MKIVTVLFLFSCSKSWGQVYVHNFGTTTISTNPYTVAPPTIDPNLNSSQWISSTGTFTSFAGSTGQALSLINSSGTPSMTLTFSVTAGCTLDISSFNFWRQRSASGAQNWTLTINGIFVGSGTVPTTGASIGTTTVANTVSGLTGNVSVVLSLSGASGTGTFRLDDFTLNGATSCGPSCTPPTTTITPTSQTVCVGSVSTISVSSSASSPSYTWQASSTAGGTYSNVVNGTPSGASYSGTNGTVLTFTAGSSTYFYRALVAEGGTCIATSGTVTVVPYTNPSITTHPANQTICSGANASFSVTASGTSITYQWQVNTGGGFTNLANGAPYSNVTTSVLTISSATTGMSGYLYQCVINPTAPCASTVTSNAATLTVLSGGDPTSAASALVTSQIACNGFNLSMTNGNGSNRLVVVSTAAVTGSPVDGTAYSANTTYGSGGTIAANQYVVYNGTGSSVYITGLSATTTYHYKVFEFNNCGGSPSYLTSGTVPSGTVTTVSCSSPAGITSVYIDACGGGCGFEGNNELIWGTTGSYAMKVATNGPALHYNSTSPPTTTFISTYSVNTTNINVLNAAVGSCTNTVFVDPNTQGYIPPNTNFVIANNCMCSPSAYDFSGLCNAGPIYVIFGTNAAWPCGSGGGIFGNQSACSGSPRYFDLNFAAWGVATAPIYDYDPCLLTSGTNGDIITLDPAGGSATSYTNSGCVVPTIVLPIELIDFYGTQNGSANDLVWKVASEINVSQYIIEKSEDGVNFSELTRVNTIGAEANFLIYSCEDPDPFSEITYYRLSTLENNQIINHYRIIDLDRGNKDWKSLVYQKNDELVVEWKNYVPKDASITLFDLSGKQLADEDASNAQTKININGFAAGIYFVRISTAYKTENFKVVIQR